MIGRPDISNEFCHRRTALSRQRHLAVIDERLGRAFRKRTDLFDSISLLQHTVEFGHTERPFGSPAAIPSTAVMETIGNIDGVLGGNRSPVLGPARPRRRPLATAQISRPLTRQL